MIDITKLWGFSQEECRKLINQNWTEGVLYRGRNFFEHFLEKIEKFVSKILSIGKSTLDYDNYDEYSPTTYKITGQMSYVGYEIVGDYFVIGFDMNKFEENIVYLKISENNEIFEINPNDRVYGRGYFYPNVYEELKSKIDLVDIVLD